MKKRIVILSAFLTPLRSGAEACAEEVALRLCDRYDITIITAKLRGDLPRKDLLQGKVPVIRVGLGLPVDKWLYPLLAPFAARRLQPDAIHAVLESFAGLTLLLCRWIIPTTKRILTLQTTNRNFLRGPIVRSPHVVTAISQYLARQTNAYGRHDVVVIPNGIPYEEIRHVCQTVKKIPGRILFVGRLERMKGVDSLLEALAFLEEDLQWEVHIIGDGSQRSALEMLWQQFSWNHRVKFCGYVSGDDLYREYAEAEIFCGLSRSEALGNVFLEAQAAGCAVIATNVGGIPEVVKAGITGILVNNTDSRTISDELSLLLSDGEERRTLADAAIEHAKQYDWNSIVTRYSQIYEQIFTASQRGSSPSPSV